LLLFIRGKVKRPLLSVDGLERALGLLVVVLNRLSGTAGHQPDGGRNAGGNKNPGLALGDFNADSHNGEHNENFSDGPGSHGR
jgi:hypothetical protein